MSDNTPLKKAIARRGVQYQPRSTTPDAEFAVADSMAADRRSKVQAARNKLKQLPTKSK
jgi:hypothetical protein